MTNMDRGIKVKTRKKAATKAREAVLKTVWGTKKVIALNTGNSLVGILIL